MLDIVPNTENRPRSIMSMELSPYLLSASPPVSEFSLHSLSVATNYRPYSFFSPPSSRLSPACAKVYSTLCASSPPKSSMSISPEDSTSISFLSTTTLSETPSCQSIKPKKRVSFADDSGFPLAEVRTMLDNPAAPPVLSIRGVSDLSVEDGQSDRNANPLILPNPQPWARPNFEDDLRRNLVGVENVYARGYELICSIFVDQRPASKRVFGRCSLDSWNTFQDVVAVYSQLRRPGYETYQFNFTVPPTADRSKPIQFAVCFEADGAQHWDNNEGKNFVVHWTQEQDSDTSSTNFDSSSSSSADFGGLVWCSYENNKPYK